MLPRESLQHHGLRMLCAGAQHIPSKSHIISKTCIGSHSVCRLGLRWMPYPSLPVDPLPCRHVCLPKFMPCISACVMYALWNLVHIASSLTGLVQLVKFGRGSKLSEGLVHVSQVPGWMYHPGSILHAIVPACPIS